MQIKSKHCYGACHVTCSGHIDKQVSIFFHLKNVELGLLYAVVCPWMTKVSRDSDGTFLIFGNYSIHQMIISYLWRPFSGLGGGECKLPYVECQLAGAVTTRLEFIDYLTRQPTDFSAYTPNSWCFSCCPILPYKMREFPLGSINWYNFWIDTSWCH